MKKQFVTAGYWGNNGYFYEIYGTNKKVFNNFKTYQEALNEGEKALKNEQNKG